MNSGASRCTQGQAGACRGKQVHEGGKQVHAGAHRGKRVHASAYRGKQVHAGGAFISMKTNRCPHPVQLVKQIFRKQVIGIPKSKQF